MKTSELTGAALDWAVAKCEGIELESGYGVQETSGYYNRLLVDGRMSKGQSMLVRYIPSTDWAQAGPIIEREGIAIDCIRCNGNIDGWQAANMVADDENWDAGVQYGPTPLIAAMRVLVASKLGDEVDIPEELTGVAA
jgi:hypothetical protein